MVTDGAASILREKVLVLVPPALSLTFSVKVKVPVAFGLPVRDPPAAMASHEGSVVPASANV